MFKVLPALKDAYITDRVINGTAQTSANVGGAGSLDLFKLYGVTTTPISGSSVPNLELSRLLIQFDLSSLRTLVADGLVDVTNASFNCHLHLFDVYGGQPTPNNFTVSVFPLSGAFDEGFGQDVVYYSDQDTCNWLTGTMATGSWFITGCGLGGTSTTPCDYVTALTGGLSMQFQQTFVTGLEDLDIDITPIVSATLAGMLPDVGLRISFSAPLEANQYSYFVKRFASRSAFNSDFHPVIYVRYDSSIQDDTDNVYMDATNYLFMYNYNRSAPTNLTSGSSQITGKNCLELMLVSDFPALAPGVISSSVVYEPTGPFAFDPTSTVEFTGSYSYPFTGSVIVHSGGFAFLTSSQGASLVAFTGFYTGSIHGIGFAADLLLIGSMVGTYTVPVPYGIPSGTYFYRTGPAQGWDITTPILTGSALFTGTLQGTTFSDIYFLTGTFSPADVTSPQEFPYLFSASYTLSATYVTAETSGSVISVNSSILSGTYITLPEMVPSGNFVLVDGITPVLSGIVSVFTGSIDGNINLYALTGTFLPFGPFVFSASYTQSSSLGPVDFTLGPFSASQYYSGINPQVGIYSASVFIPSTDPDLLPQWQFSGSVQFTPVWRSLDGTFPYLTGSTITVFAPQRGTRALPPKKFDVSIKGLSEQFDNNQQTVLRVFIFDYTLSYVTSVARLPVELPGVVVRDAHYQVRDLATNRLVIPFDTVTNSTRVSNDSAGMYFNLDTSSLTPNRSYVIDILIVTGGNQQLYKAVSPTFRVGAVS